MQISCARRRPKKSESRDYTAAQSVRVNATFAPKSDGQVDFRCGLPVAYALLWHGSMQAQVPMTRRVLVVPPDLSLASAWVVMQRDRLRHLPVVRNGALIGMLSDRDILVRSRLDETGRVLVRAEITIGEAMTPAPLTTCDATTDIANIVRVMTEQKIDAVPVVRGSKLVGLVTSTDLLLLLVKLDESQLLPFEFDIVEDAVAYA